MVFAACLAGCSSSLQSGQTPDDLYYAPVALRAEPIARQQTDDGLQPPRAGGYQEAINRDDRYLRMKSRNRNRWGNMDDYAYWNDSRYDHSYDCGCRGFAPSFHPGIGTSYSIYNYGMGSDYGGYGNGFSYRNGYGYNSFYNGYGYPGQSYWGYNNYNPYGNYYGYNSPVYIISGQQGGQNPGRYTNPSNIPNSYSNHDYQNSNANKPLYNPPASNNYIRRENVDRPVRYFTPSGNSTGGRSGGFGSSNGGGSRPRAGR